MSNGQYFNASNRLLAARALALAWAGAFLCAPAPAETPSTAALKAVESLRANRMGVDRQGNLWAWNKQTASVAVLSPAGQGLEPWKAPAAEAVDVDAEWGLVGLYKLGREIRWSRRGAPDVVLPLAARSLDICWLGPATVAVTPVANEDRVEIWNLKDAVLARRFGRERAIGPGPGAARLRSVLLRCDPARQRLFSLESESGDLQVHDLAGKLLWRASLGDPDHAEIASWLREADARARKQGASERPIFLRLFPALDGQGTLWAVPDIHDATKTAELVSATAGGTGRRTLSNLPCLSRTIAFWGDHVVFYQEPATPRAACTGIGRLP